MNACSRRDLLAAGVALGVAHLVRCTRGAPAHRSPPSAGDPSAREAIRRMKAGETTAESYAESLLARADASRRLNAFITLDRDRVLESARQLDLLRKQGKADGPLHGLPVAVKDVIDTAGIRTTYATAALKGHVATKNAAIVERMVAAGAIVFGKTNCDELSFGNASQSSAFGGVKNPFDLDAVTGGSSGGSAAAVGAHVVPVAIGADTTGSIRMPAALCGAKGLRPSTGRYSTAGVWPISPTLDTVGPIAGAVEDLMLFDRVLSDDPGAFPAVALPGLRLGVPRKHFFSRIDDPVWLAVLEEALDALRRGGAVLVEADFPDTSLFDPFAVAYPILFTETPSAMRGFIADNSIPATLEQVYERFTPDVKGWFDEYVFASPPKYDRAKSLSDRRTLIAHYGEYYSRNQVDLLIVPATPFPAPKIGQSTIQFDHRAVAPLDVIENSTAVGAVVGDPGVTIPVGRVKGGLPVSLLLEAPHGHDRRLLAAARAIEPIFAGALGG